MDVILRIHLSSLVLKTSGKCEQTLPRHAHGARRSNPVQRIFYRPLPDVVFIRCRDHRVFLL